MKNLVKIVAVLTLGVFLLIPSMVMADLVTSNPTVESFHDSSEVLWQGVYWHSVIADSGDHNFDISGATLTSGLLKIFTGWPSASFSEYHAVAADLYLISGGYTWAIRLNSSGLGDVFRNPTMQTSVDVFAGFSVTYGYIYGGAYGGAGNAQPIPVLATGSPTYGPISDLVKWKTTNEVDIDLSFLTGYGFNIDNFSFLYAAATCGNSVLTGGTLSSVPIPPTALLLGTGLLGLVGLGWRRRRQSS